MWNWSRANLIALFSLVVALSLAVAAGRRPLSAGLPPEPRLPTAKSTAPAGSDPTRVRLVSDAAALDRLVLRTVARNPFRPDRARDGGRLRFAGAEGTAPQGQAALAPAVVPVSPAVREPIPQFRVVGLVAMGEGKGLVALELPGAPPRLLNVGDVLAGFRVVSVSSSEARLRGQDTTLVLTPRQP